MNCQQFREIIDSYLADELLVETNHGVLRHLEDCRLCRQELAARRELKRRLRFAVKNAPDSQINPAFARNLEAKLRQTALNRRPTFWEKIKAAELFKSPVRSAGLIGAAACLLIGIFFGVNYFRQNSGVNIAGKQKNETNQTVAKSPAENPNEPQVIEAAWRETAPSAIGDHENCALHFNLKEKPISLDEAAKRFGAFYKDFDKAVGTAFREGEQNERNEKIEILAAHSCLFEGRRFAHVVLRKGKNTISVLVTETNSTATDNQTIANQTAAENLHVAGFQKNRFAVFVVSDLSGRDNEEFAERLAPAVRRHLEKFAA